MTDVKNSTPTDCSYKDEIGWFSTSGFYWSSTESSYGPDFAWRVDLGNDRGYRSTKSYTGSVRTVLAF